jgi:hypothetical protein
MRWGVHPTALEPLVLLRTPFGLAGIGFAYADDPEPIATALTFLGKGARPTANPAATAAFAGAVVARDGRLPVDLQGTSFQAHLRAAVLDLSETVPYGAATRTPKRPAMAQAAG